MPETAREEAEALAKEIADAVEEYRRSFPEPYALPPNLGLAVRALALLSVPETENWEYGVRWVHTVGQPVTDRGADPELDAERRFVLIEQGAPERADSFARSLTAPRLQRVISGQWDNGKGAPTGGGFEFRTLTKQVDATALLAMERDEMIDTVVASYFDSSRRRGPSLVRFSDPTQRYLVARNSDDEGFYLVWGGVDENTDFTEDVYEACVAEGEARGLKPIYHVYSRFNLFATPGVHWYQIPDRTRT